MDHKTLSGGRASRRRGKGKLKQSGSIRISGWYEHDLIHFGTLYCHQLTIDMMVDSQIPTTSFLLYSNDTFRVRERFIVGIERAFRDNRTNPSNSGGQAAYYASLLNLSATGSVYVYGDIDLKENANAVRKSLMRIDDAVLEPTLDLEDALDDIKDICWNVETAMDYTDWLVAKASVGASLAMLFSTLLFLLLPYIPHRGTQSRVSRFLSWVHGFVSWCMAPILILSIIVLILATCLVLVTGIVNADFCSGSGSLQASFSPGPSETFLTALVGNKVPQDSFKYRAAKYVMDGCRTPYTSPEYPLSFADAFQEQVEDCIQNVATLKDNIGYLEPVKLTRVIGYPMDLVFTDMRELKDMLVSAKESMQQMLRPLDCVQLHDLYVQNIEEATCQTSAQAFVGLFVCLLIMTVGCCLMLTFRVAILECKEEHNDACSQSGSTAQTHDKEKNTHRDDGDASVKLVVGVGIVIPDRSTHEFALDDDSLHSLPPPFRSSSSVEDGDEPEARLMESVSEFAQPLHIGGHTWYDI